MFSILFELTCTNNEEIIILLIYNVITSCYYEFYLDRQKGFDRGRTLITVEAKVRMRKKYQSATNPVELE